MTQCRGASSGHDDCAAMICLLTLCASWRDYVCANSVLWLWFVDMLTLYVKTAVTGRTARLSAEPAHTHTHMTELIHTSRAFQTCTVSNVIYSAPHCMHRPDTATHRITRLPPHLSSTRRNLALGIKACLHTHTWQCRGEGRCIDHGMQRGAEV